MITDARPALEPPSSAVPAWLRQTKRLSLGIAMFLTSCFRLVAFSAQPANLFAARLNTRSARRTSSVVPAPPFSQKVEQVLH